MIEAEVVNINSADNSVQVRVHGYQDDKGGIPDEGLQWVKCLGQHAGIAGATATHPYYVGSKVMLSMSGQQMFIVGSVTGYDSDQSKNKTDADNSDDKDPNTPRQVRGTKGPANRTIPAGEGTDQTSKATRSVTKTDKQYDQEQPEKVYDYSKGTAPFEKGKPAKFTDLMSIGIQKLSQGSNVLDTIDQMDNNVSGAIQAGTKIIRNMQQGGFGDAMSMMNTGGAMNQGTQQVADYHGNLQLRALLAALLALVQTRGQVRNRSIDSTVAQVLRYETFNVDPSIIQRLTDDIASITSLSGALLEAKINQIVVDFDAGFSQAISQTINYVQSIVDQNGMGALAVGLDPDSLIQLAQTMQAGAEAAGIPAEIVQAIGGGQLQQVVTQGLGAVQSIMQQAQGMMGQLQGMMQNMNIFGSEMNAMSEMMGGGQSLQESLSGIVMKFNKKRINLDLKGFTQ